MSSFLVKFLSRKLLVAAACFTIVLLDGLGVAHFADGVVGVAVAGLVAYIGVQGLADAY